MQTPVFAACNRWSGTLRGRWPSPASHELPTNSHRVAGRELNARRLSLAPCSAVPGWLSVANTSWDRLGTYTARVTIKTHASISTVPPFAAGGLGATTATGNQDHPEDVAN